MVQKLLATRNLETQVHGEKRFSDSGLAIHNADTARRQEVLDQPLDITGLNLVKALAREALASAFGLIWLIFRRWWVG